MSASYKECFFHLFCKSMEWFSQASDIGCYKVNKCKSKKKDRIMVIINTTTNNNNDRYNNNTDSSCF